MASNSNLSLNLGYSNASFEGNYGFSIIFGARIAVGIGLAISDGKGNFHGNKSSMRAEILSPKPM